MILKQLILSCMVFNIALIYAGPIQSRVVVPKIESPESIARKRELDEKCKDPLWQAIYFSHWSGPGIWFQLVLEGIDQPRDYNRQFQVLGKYMTLIDKTQFAIEELSKRLAKRGNFWDEKNTLKEVRKFKRMLLAKGAIPFEGKKIDYIVHFIAQTKDPALLATRLEMLKGSAWKDQLPIIQERLTALMFLSNKHRELSGLC